MHRMRLSRYSGNSQTIPHYCFALFQTIHSTLATRSTHLTANLAQSNGVKGHTCTRLQEVHLSVETTLSEGENFVQGLFQQGKFHERTISPILEFPNLPTASRTPSHASPSSVQSQKSLQIQLPLKAAVVHNI